MMGKMHWVRGQKGGWYASVQIKVYLVHLSHANTILSSKQVVRALGKGPLQPSLAGYWNHWLRAWQQLEKQQNTVRAPSERVLATKQMAFWGYRKAPEQTHSLHLPCRRIWPHAPQRGQRGIRHGNEIFEGWSHGPAQKDQKDFDCLAWRGKSRAGYNCGYQGHYKLSGELLFPKSCNVRAEGHSMKLAGGGFKRDERCTALHSQVWTSRTCCSRTLWF